MLRKDCFLIASSLRMISLSVINYRPGCFARPTTGFIVLLGQSSPAKPALTNPVPLSIIILGAYSTSVVIFFIIIIIYL